MVRANNKWSFDASEAPVEMQARRIGANELDAIEICHGYVEAQLNLNYARKPDSAHRWHGQRRGCRAAGLNPL
jgi:hypothetical protein